MKKFKNFTLEGNDYSSDFDFKTTLSDSEITYTNYGDKYDDYEDINAVVYWKLNFDWMGDEGVDYYVTVNKVELNFTTVIFEDDDEIKDEQSLTIDDYDKITIDNSNPRTQIMPQEIVVDGDLVDVTF